jgi:uncharacterized protein (TIGR02301 family)
MTPRTKQLLSLAVGLFWFAGGLTAFIPPAHARFFLFDLFSNDERPKAKPAEPAVPVAPPGDDLPPIEPQATLPPPPPPPDDKPYDPKLLRLAEILGSLHYLRALCGADEGQLWREQMEQIVHDEGTTAVRRAKLVNSFNDGYRGFRRTYRTCNDSAIVAIDRFVDEGSGIAFALAKPSEPGKEPPKRPDKKHAENNADLEQARK